MLDVNGATNSKGRVELYERGYGKDAAGIAKEAITYGKLARAAPSCSILTRIPVARDNDFDVVLIDTAGRMQDNEVCSLPKVEAAISSRIMLDSRSCVHSRRYAHPAAD